MKKSQFTQSSPLLKNVLFINLEHRIDRLNEVKQEFETMGINAERFNAIKMENGAIGCTLSHIKCLEIAIERNYDYVFICEDDIQFLNPQHFLEGIREFQMNPPKDWNMFIMGGNIVPPFKMYNNTCINILNTQTTTGYITHKIYYKTLLNNFKEGLELLLKNPKLTRYYAIDQYWKRLQLTGTWYMLYPPTITQRRSYSDIEKRTVDYSGLILDLEKNYIFNNKNNINTTNTTNTTTKTNINTTNTSNATNPTNKMLFTK